LDASDGLNWHNMAGPSVVGERFLDEATRVQLDHTLKLMDPNSPETLGKVGMLQAHGTTVHGICQDCRPWIPGISQE
jgi:hypothetical protein